MPRQEAIISVVIPAHNAAGSVAATLRSLIPDRGLIREILLVDDASADATAEMATDIAQRHDLPLRILPAAFQNAGASRNHGLAQAQGRLLFFIDADDELVPGALGMLATKLIENPTAGVAIGACIRRATNRPDKMRIPCGYTEDRRQNAIRYLGNEIWAIAMGSALLVTAHAADIRFPETIGLDEDTCFWVALLARVQVVTVADPVLLYKLDEPRMARRYATAPRKTLLSLSRAFKMLAEHGMPRAVLRRRAAWLALRMARQLIINRQYRDAAKLLRFARAHPDYRKTWDVFRYGCSIQAGSFCQRLGLRPPLAVSRNFADLKGPRRILMVTVDDASSPVSGADLRNHQNAVSAAKLGLVTVVSLRSKNSEIATHKSGMEFISAGVTGERSKAISSRRCSVEARISHACLARLLTVIRDFGPDTIIIEGVPLATLLKYLRPLAKLLILDMHNIESELAARRPAALAGTLKNDVARIRRLETKALQWVDQVWVCSEEDRERLVELYRPSVPVEVVPNSIPRFETLRQERRSRADKQAGDPVLLFVGHLDYWPNMTAAERLVREILPRVRQIFPGATVILAGRHPQAAVQSLAALPGVELQANPESLTEFYRRADIAVVPLADGGGTRLKILEAMAAGLPVVATSVAVEGLGAVDGEEVRLADSDEGLARQVVELWRNVEARKRQSGFAEKTARLRFGPGAVDLAVKRGLTA